VLYRSFEEEHHQREIIREVRARRRQRLRATGLRWNELKHNGDDTRPRTESEIIHHAVNLNGSEWDDVDMTICSCVGIGGGRTSAIKEPLVFVLRDK
jgi:hypothetical protein